MEKSANHIGRNSCRKIAKIVICVAFCIGLQVNLYALESSNPLPVPDNVTIQDYYVLDNGGDVSYIILNTDSGLLFFRSDDGGLNYFAAYPGFKFLYDEIIDTNFHFFPDFACVSVVSSNGTDNSINILYLDEEEQLSLVGGGAYFTSVSDIRKYSIFSITSKDLVVFVMDGSGLQYKYYSLFSEKAKLKNIIASQDIQPGFYIKTTGNEADTPLAGCYYVPNENGSLDLVFFQTDLFSDSVQTAVIGQCSSIAGRIDIYAPEDKSHLFVFDDNDVIYVTRLDASGSAETFRFALSSRPSQYAALRETNGFSLVASVNGELEFIKFQDGVQKNIPMETDADRFFIAYENYYDRIVFANDLAQNSEIRMFHFNYVDATFSETDVLPAGYSGQLVLDSSANGTLLTGNVSGDRVTMFTYNAALKTFEYSCELADPECAGCKIEKLFSSFSLQIYRIGELYLIVNTENKNLEILNADFLQYDYTKLHLLRRDGSGFTQSVLSTGSGMDN